MGCLLLIGLGSYFSQLQGEAEGDQWQALFERLQVRAQAHWRPLEARLEANLSHQRFKRLPRSVQDQYLERKGEYLLKQCEEEEPYIQMSH